MIPKPFIVLMGIALMLVMPVHAGEYRKCVDEAGKVTLSNSKCPDRSKTVSSFVSSNFRSPKAELPPSKYDEQLNAVVRIKSSRATGSGFFVTSGGLIVTNYHVVGTDRTVKIKLRTQKQIIYGNVLATDQTRDLALVSVNGQDFQWLRLGTTHGTIIGEEVIAIGAPVGLEWTLTKGVVSAVRTVRSAQDFRSARDIGSVSEWGVRDAVRFIQTDAAINPGNSGGPLISVESLSVLGVNTLTARKDIAEGLSFSVSSEEILEAFGRYLTRN